MEQRKIADGVIAAMRQAGSIAVCCHVNPDGDTIGSALALAHGLMLLGKQVRIFCQDKVPDVLHILPGWEWVYTPDKAAGRQFDLLLPVDVSDEDRLGSCGAIKALCAHSAQIDHHGTNPGYCEWNDVDGHAPATAVMVYAALRQLNVQIDRAMAVCLYAGLTTDTGNFAFSNTTAEAFQVAAELMAHQLPLSAMNRTLFRVKPACQLRLLTRALESLRFHAGGKIAAMALTQKDFADCGALPEHADTIVNYGVDTAGVCMAMLARENPDGSVKVSLRAVENRNVAGVAQRFGGGGHAQAAGCTVAGPLEEAVKNVVRAMEEEIAP